MSRELSLIHIYLRRQGRFQGYTSSWKKAVVTVSEDSKAIEFFEGMM